jgi:hypothetical protein
VLSEFDFVLLPVAALLLFFSYQTVHCRFSFSSPLRDLDVIKEGKRCQRKFAVREFTLLYQHSVNIPLGMKTKLYKTRNGSKHKRQTNVPNPTRHSDERKLG